MFLRMNNPLRGSQRGIRRVCRVLIFRFLEEQASAPGISCHLRVKRAEIRPFSLYSPRRGCFRMLKARIRRQLWSDRDSCCSDQAPPQGAAGRSSDQEGSLRGVAGLSSGAEGRAQAMLLPSIGSRLLRRSQSLLASRAHGSDSSAGENSSRESMTWIWQASFDMCRCSDCPGAVLWG